MDASDLEALCTRLENLRNEARDVEDDSVYFDTADTAAGEWYMRHSPERYIRVVDAHLKLIQEARQALSATGSLDYAYGLFFAVTAVVIPFVEEGERPPA